MPFRLRRAEFVLQGINELFATRDQSKKRIKGIQAKLEQARKAAAALERVL